MKVFRLTLVLLMIVCFAIGCSSQQVQESEFWDHPSVYKNWDHLKFSTAGYKNPNPDVGQKSKEQGWWGIPIDVDSGQ